MRLLLVPAVERNQGTGHLRRCLGLLEAWGDQARILLPRDSSPRERGWEEVRQLLSPELTPEQVIFEPSQWEDSVVLVDRRETSREDFRKIVRRRVSLGIDEGGEARELFSYLIDTFPRLSRSLRGNIQDPRLIAPGAPAEKKVPPRRLRRVLLSFGGEDPGGLTRKTLRSLLASGLFSPEDIHLVLGPAFSDQEVLHRAARSQNSGNGRSPGEPRFFRGLKELRPLLGSYDGVFTSFGLTPYEAEKEGSLPILVNPTRYHQRLSRRAGFPSLGVGGVNRRKLKKIVLNPQKYQKKTRSAAAAGDLFSLLQGLRPPGPPDCPVCGTGENPATFRNGETSFFRCRRCRIVYMLRFSPEEVRYDQNYFFRDYRRQYGRTYLEDFEQIKQISRWRLKILSDLMGEGKGKKLLDVGCAYGPFLAAAREEGFSAQGLDIAEEAVRYVRQELGIPAERGDFLSWEPGEGFDVISLWYVAEHFNPLGQGLEKAARLVRPGGFLILSTPNLRGVTGRFNRHRFFDQSPGDHYTLWDPRSARAALEIFGFKIRKIRHTGIHRERFPLPFRVLLGRRGCLWAGRIFGLGDTFEIYAQRQDDG